mgnify:FL=1
MGILLTAALTGMGWAVKYLVSENNRKHVEHFAHAECDEVHQSLQERKALAQVVEAKIDAHEKLDQERFKRIEESLDELKADMKLLLKRRTK